MVDCYEISPELLLPKLFESSERIDDILKVAQAVLEALPPEAKLTPWVIGSTDLDIAGNPRASRSHAEHRAFDISPCYSMEELIPQDRRVMGIAWNLVSLLTIQGACDVALCCAEGDHLHVMIDGAPVGRTYAVPTISTWYPSAEVMQLSPAQIIFNKLFILDNATLRPATKSEGDEFVHLFE